MNIGRCVRAVLHTGLGYPAWMVGTPSYPCPSLSRDFRRWSRGWALSRNITEVIDVDIPANACLVIRKNDNFPKSQSQSGSSNRREFRDEKVWSNRGFTELGNLCHLTARAGKYVALIQSSDSQIVSREKQLGVSTQSGGVQISE